MTTANATEKIVEHLGALPPEKIEEILAIVTRMRRFEELRRPRSSAEGLAPDPEADLPLELFVQARREVWGGSESER